MNVDSSPAIRAVNEHAGALDSVGVRYQLEGGSLVVPACPECGRKSRISATAQGILSSSCGHVASQGNRGRGVGRMLINGAEFILDNDVDVLPVWGEGERVAWAAGETLLVAGPPGVGKTTLVQQLTLARIGIRGDVLGLPVTPTASRVLYLASDRPRQIARSFRRMIHDREDDREALAERLAVWQGPLPTDVAEDPEVLLELAREANADTIVIDSLKDVAMGLSDDKVGNAVARSWAHCVAAGVEVVALHHQRKMHQGGTPPTSLADVYGSAWIAAAAGSVLLVWGSAGDFVVTMKHLKQPVADIGPLRLVHDHDTGTTTVEGAVDLIAYASQAGPTGVSAKDAAQAIYGTPSPGRNEIEKAQRRLTRLEGLGLIREPGQRGGAAARWRASLRASEMPVATLASA